MKELRAYFSLLLSLQVLLYPEKVLGIESRSESKVICEVFR